MDKRIFTVKVQTKAKRAGVGKIDAGTYRVRVHAAPEKGAANKEVMAALANYFDIPPSAVKIIRGKKSRVKLIEIAG